VEPYRSYSHDSAFPARVDVPLENVENASNLNLSMKRGKVKKGREEHLKIDILRLRIEAPG
jgi:hypothetical protein